MPLRPSRLAQGSRTAGAIAVIAAATRAGLRHESRSPREGKAGRRFANAFVDARMMEWLLALPSGWGFEVSEPWILGYRDQSKPREVESVLETLEGFVGRIPSVVHSLYPTGLSPIAPRPMWSPELSDTAREISAGWQGFLPRRTGSTRAAGWGTREVAPTADGHPLCGACREELVSSPVVDPLTTSGEGRGPIPTSRRARIVATRA